LGLWINSKKAKINPEETEKYFWSLPKEEREKLCIPISLH